MSSRALRMVAIANNGENPQSPTRDTRPIMERLMYVTPKDQMTVPKNLLRRPHPVRSRRAINFDLDAARTEIILVSPPVNNE